MLRVCIKILKASSSLKGSRFENPENGIPAKTPIRSKRSEFQKDGCAVYLTGLSMPAFLHSLRLEWGRMEASGNLRLAGIREKRIIGGGRCHLTDGKFWTKLPVKYARNFIISRCCRGSSKRTNNDISLAVCGVRRVNCHGTV